MNPYLIMNVSAVNYAATGSKGFQAPVMLLIVINNYQLKQTHKVFIHVALKHSMNC